MICPACIEKVDSSKRIIFTDSKFSIYVCKNCGMGITSPQPSKDEIMNYYPQNYYAHALRKESVINKFHNMVKLYKCGKRYNFILDKIFLTLGHFINFTLPAPFGSKTMLEIGCGSGENLLLVKELGWAVYGIEPSIQAVKNAEENGLHDVKLGFGDDLEIQENKYDLIFMNHSLEHTYNPYLILQKCYQSLSKNGQIVFTVPKFNSRAREIFGEQWNAYQVPQHLYHFSTKSVHHLMKNIGFNDIVIKEQTFIISVLLNIRNLISTLRHSKKGSRRIMKHLKLLFRKSENTFSDIMVVTAQK